MRSNPNHSSHFYFNRLSRLWSHLPPLDASLSPTTIHCKLLNIFWNYLIANLKIREIHVLITIDVLVQYVVTHQPGQATMYHDLNHFCGLIELTGNPSAAKYVILLSFLMTKKHTQ